MKNRYEIKWIYIPCEACDGDGVDDSQGAHVGCMMCGGTGKNSVQWNPIWDVTLSKDTNLDKLAEELKIDYLLPAKYYLELLIRVALRCCDSEYINSRYFKDIVLRYMEHEATDEGCERIHVMLYKWADANLPPCRSPWNLYDKVYQIEKMNPKQIKALDLAKVISDAMWEGRQETSKQTHSDPRRYIDDCYDIDYCF